MKDFFLVFAIICGLGVTIASENGLGRLPPMGWNTWCTLGACGRDYCDETEILEMTDAMVNNGMKALGYKHINLDDCWGGPRTAGGNLTADATRFPRGMKYVADYVHSKGLLLGVYLCAGTKTCVGDRPGSYGHYQQDADVLASWGVDLVKMDWCSTTGLDPRVQYPEMYKALNKTGRPIFFALCEWGLDNPWEWGPAIANSWRCTGDHHDNWGSTSGIIENMASLGKYAGPGGWNDPDFLMTGGGGQTEAEYRTEFSLWSIMAANMFVATDIRNLTSFKKSVLLNTEIIAVSQDKLAKAGGRLSSGAAGEVWARPLEDGSIAIGLYNSKNQTETIVVMWAQLGWLETKSASVRDLWAHKDLGTFTESFKASVPSHDTFLIIAK